MKLTIKNIKKIEGMWVDTNTAIYEVQHVEERQNDYRIFLKFIEGRKDGRTYIDQAQFTIIRENGYSVVQEWAMVNSFSSHPVTLLPKTQFELTTFIQLLGQELNR